MVNISFSDQIKNIFLNIHRWCTLYWCSFYPPGWCNRGRTWRNSWGFFVNLFEILPQYWLQQEINNPVMGTNR